MFCCSRWFSFILSWKQNVLLTSGCLRHHILLRILWGICYGYFNNWGICHWSPSLHWIFLYLFPFSWETGLKIFQPKTNMLEYITSPKLKSLLGLQTRHPIPSRSNVSQKALVVNVHLTQLACMASIWCFDGVILILKILLSWTPVFLLFWIRILCLWICIWRFWWGVWFYWGVGV